MRDLDNSLPEQRKNFFRRHQKGLIILGLIATTLILAYGIPVIVGDGTGKFTGKKRQIAEETIKETYANEDHMSRAVNRFYNFQYYVENVREMTPEEAEQCKDIKGNKNDLYIVELSQVTLFGIRGNNFEDANYCFINQKIKNTY